MCSRREELISVIADADKIFLRIDFSATNKMTTLRNLMHDTKQEQARPSRDRKERFIDIKANPKKEEKKEISNNVLRIMYPTSKKYLICNLVEMAARQDQFGRPRFKKEAKKGGSPITTRHTFKAKYPEQQQEEVISLEIIGVEATRKHQTRRENQRSSTQSLCCQINAKSCLYFHTNMTQ